MELHPLGPQVLPVSNSKTDKNEPALAILKAIPTVKGSPYLIVGYNEERPPPQPPETWEEPRLCVGITEVRVHDLRHTFASDDVGDGISLAIIGRPLGDKHTDLLSFASIGVHGAMLPDWG